MGHSVVVHGDEAVSWICATSAVPILLDPGELLEYRGRPSQKKHMSQQLRADRQLCPFVEISSNQMPFVAGTVDELAVSDTYMAAWMQETLFEPSSFTGTKPFRQFLQAQAPSLTSSSSTPSVNKPAGGLSHFLLFGGKQRAGSALLGFRGIHDTPLAVGQSSLTEDVVGRGVQVESAGSGTEKHPDAPSCEVVYIPGMTGQFLQTVPVPSWKVPRAQMELQLGRPP